MKATGFVGNASAVFAMFSLFVVNAVGAGTQELYPAIFIASTTFSHDDVRWHLYRNTLVALADNGQPMCIVDASKQGCWQVDSKDVIYLKNVIQEKVRLGNFSNMMLCDSPAYQSIWGPVPQAAEHWCNAYQREANTVRAVLGIETTVSKPAVTINLAAYNQFDDAAVGYTVPVQDSASGPASLISDPSIYAFEGRSFDISSKITVAAKDAATGEKYSVVLRGVNYIACEAETSMNNVIPCYGVKQSQLKVQFYLDDNRILPRGRRFTGAFTVQANVWKAAPVMARDLQFFVDIQN